MGEGFVKIILVGMNRGKLKGYCKIGSSFICKEFEDLDFLKGTWSGRRPGSHKFEVWILLEIKILFSKWTSVNAKMTPESKLVAKQYFFCNIPISAPENQWISLSKINIVDWDFLSEVSNTVFTGAWLKVDKRRRVHKCTHLGRDGF